tara:strand:+ start:390 stop:563 length:174 start_codon:yes stop_codon:yes gene_type:complete
MNTCYGTGVDPTLQELKDIFKQHKLEYFVKKEKGNIVKVHFIVRDDESTDENITNRT